jgi:16S rRNA (guanine966-N2)-methyltransferase
VVRIVAGERKGTRLAAPAGGSARPTSDRVRESLFAILADVSGASVLDPFAGSGALGLEALSRGAETAAFCDVDGAALAAVHENVRRLRYADRCTVRRQDARRRLAADRAAGVTYDLVLLDPPYSMLSALSAQLESDLPALLATGGRAVLERRAGEPAPEPGLEVIADRSYGGTAITVWRRG